MRSLHVLLAASSLFACSPPSGGDTGGGGGGGASAAGGGTSCGAGVPPREGVVFTNSGALEGKLEGGVWKHLGVRYATPPLGALRWRPPAEVTCAAGLKTTQAFGPVCPQLENDGGYLGDEDCLTLNVFAKQGVTNAPVLVYIHGGGNTTGTASDPLFDGTDLANRHGVVVVTVEYRLGALGNYLSTQLVAESDAGVAGNYGLLDQQLALRWIKSNIEAFGGDPARTMLFGESAGGQDTLLHLVSPMAQGLFSAAIVESGGVYRVTLAEGLVTMAELTRTAGCDTAADPLACMRSKSARELATVPSATGPGSATKFSYHPVIDGVVIPDQPLTLMQQGRHHKVPLIIGTNADETSREVGGVTDEPSYQQALRARYGIQAADLILAQYPVSRFASARQAMIAVTTDSAFTCGTRRIARAIAANQPQPVHRYFFSWRLMTPAGLQLGATHGLELAFVFRTFGVFGNGFNPPADAVSLSSSIQAYWTRFAATGSPNHTGAFDWPAFTATGNDALELGNSGVSLNPSVRAADCDFWDSF